MATYKKEKGFAVQTLSSDTAASVAATGSWSSQSGMNEGRKGLSGFGTYTAAIAATGNDPSTVNSVESWDGSSWTEVNNVNTAKFYRGNNGTATAGLIIGGAPSTGDVEEWDGTNWTETANYPGNITGLIQLGTQTAAFCIGGDVPPYTTATNTYNGSSFTSSTAINTARSSGIGSGSTTAAVVAGGSTPSATAATELWNGSAWTEVNDLNTARDLLAGSGSSSTNSLAFGGLSTALASTESWDGTTWTEVADLATGRRELGGSTNGSNTQALAFSGCTSPGAVQTATEQWTTTPAATFTQINLGQVYFNSTSNAFKVTATSVATGSWAAGGALNTARSASMGAGSQTAGIVAGGFIPPSYTPVSVVTEQYNGSSWTEVGDLNEATSSGGMAHNSPYSDTVRFGGNGNTDKTETWNNSSWTAVGDLNTGRIGGSGYGSSSSLAGYAGGDPVSSNINETWDGSSWTEVNDLNSARRYGAGVGTTTAALVVAGDTDNPSFPGGRYTARVESWDGSSFTEVGDLNTGGAYRGTSGTQTQAIAFGGGDPSPYVTITEAWNGTSWTEVADLANARRAWASGIGVAAGAGLAAGGEGPSSNLDATEEFTAATANSTITLG